MPRGGVGTKVPSVKVQKPTAGRGVRKMSAASLPSAVKSSAPKAAPAKAPTIKATPKPSMSTAVSLEQPRRMTAAERFPKVSASPVKTPKVTVQEAPPAYTKPMKSPGRSGNMDEESFGKAFAHYRKAGNKVFTWRGKKYTTQLKEEV